MAKIVLTTSDLKKLPEDVQNVLKEYLFGEKTSSKLDVDIHNSNSAPSEEKNEIFYSPVDTMSLEASIAFLSGLDPSTSIPTISMLLRKSSASPLEIAEVVGKTSEKGINGLVGSINRRFKGLFESPETAQNLIYFRKNEKVFEIEDSFHSSLSFGLWAVGHDIDWEGVKEIKWEADYIPRKVHVHDGDRNIDYTDFERDMPDKIRLNLSSIKNFIKRESLGNGRYVGETFDLDDGSVAGGHQVVLSNSDNYNSLVYFSQASETMWFVGEDFIATDMEGEPDQFLRQFGRYTLEPDYQFLGRLIPFYREQKIHGQKIGKKYAAEELDLTADIGKFGFFSYEDAPRDSRDGVGGFHWFANEKDALEYIEKVLPHDPPGPSGMPADRVASRCQAIIKKRVQLGAHYLLGDLMSDLNSALAGFSQIEWIGTFETLASRAEKNDFLEGVFENFFIRLNCEPYDGPVKNKDLAVFKETLNTFGS